MCFFYDLKFNSFRCQFEVEINCTSRKLQILTSRCRTNYTNKVNSPLNHSNTIKLKEMLNSVIGALVKGTKIEISC